MVTDNELNGRDKGRTVKAKTCCTYSKKGFWLGVRDFTLQQGGAISKKSYISVPGFIAIVTAESTLAELNKGLKRTGFRHQGCLEKGSWSRNDEEEFP